MADNVNAGVRFVVSLTCSAAVLIATVMGMQECRTRGRERAALQRFFVERCQGTPAQAEQVHPYPDKH